MFPPKHRRPASPTTRSPRPRRSSRIRSGSGPGSGRGARPARPLVVTGGIAACAAAASGLAVLTTLTAIGWITAPHVGIGTGLGGVLRTAAVLWLVAHHVGFTVRGAGRIGMLPLGLVLLPGALLAMAGRWVVRAGAVTRLRHVGYAAIALALPYTLLAGALAVACRTAQAAPSLWQAVVASFLLALVAGGLGAPRGLAPWSRLARLLPARPRSIVLGVLGAVALLAAAGAAPGRRIPRRAPDGGQGGHRRAGARPGRRGAAAARPGGLRPERDHLGRRLHAGSRASRSAPAPWSRPPARRSARSRCSRCWPRCRRAPGPAGSVVILVMAVPYLAGVFAGIVTVRVTPTPAIEAAAAVGLRGGRRRRAPWPAWRRRSPAARSATAAWPRSARPGGRSAWWPCWRSA